MNKREIKTAVRSRMAAGETKARIYDDLTEQGGKKRLVAHYIASYAAPRLKRQHKGKLIALMVVMVLQAGLAFLIGTGMAAQRHADSPLIWGTVFAAVPLLFAWGFYKPSALAYNAFIFLTIIQMPRTFSGFSEAPVASSIGIAINLAVLAYVWFVRSRLFPDFGFVTPTKVKGDYVFAD